MEIFEYILILLAAVMLANLVNHFLPMLSVPVVQIILGVLIAVVPFGILGFEFDLQPELFFILFIAPLVFRSSVTLDKRALGNMIKPILLASVVLLLLSIVAGGYLAYALIPTIPLAAAFTLAAGLAPTDIVAVEAVAHRVYLPRKMMGVLAGESIINDATGIVCFQFAVIAVLTGSFNPLQGLGRFLFLSLGGLLVGALLTALKYILVRWLRLLGINTASLHISVELLTPFIIFMVADGLGTSGILAVFGAGLLHALFRDKYNPEVVSLNNAQESVWSVVSFGLDGLVFVMLGTQLPRILSVYINGGSRISGWHIVGYVLILSVALTAIRFVWWFVTARRATYFEPENPLGKVRASLIFSVAGARSAVPMASVLSIPLFLPGDITPFPERELIIIVASGVIVVSLLLTNFIMPLLLRKQEESISDDAQAARAEILQSVMERLKAAATPENFAATEIVTRNYYSRIRRQPGDRRNIRGPLIKRPHWDILQWEKDVVLHMAEMDQINSATAELYIEKVDRLLARRKKKRPPLRLLLWTARHVFESLTWWRDVQHKKILDIKETNAKLVREKLEALHLADDDPALAIIAAEHEQVVSTRMGLSAGEDGGEEEHSRVLNEVAANGFYMERVLIQNMLEAGRLPVKTAKEMQANIIMLEAALM